jgi:hypothetical protein
MLRAMRALLLPLLLLPADDPFAAGVSAYRAGAYKEAYAAFAAVVAEDTGAADNAIAAPAHYNQGLAALRAGMWREAEAAVGKAASLAGGEFVARRDFVRGNLALARSANAQAQASGPEAEPFAFDVAIAQAEAAVRAWQAAAMSRDDWPEARRNVERALLAVAELQRLKAAAEGKQQSKKEQAPAELPTPEPVPEQAEPELAAPDAQAGDHGADLVARLLERLARKERERRRVRHDAQLTARGATERDW